MKNLPPIPRQLENFVKSLAGHIANGAKMASEEERKERLDICDSCEEKRPDNRCAVCGCSVLTKTKWASEKCPLDKWLPSAE